MSEQGYKAVLALIADGRTVTEVARDQGVHRQTLHRWLALDEGALSGWGPDQSRESHRQRAITRPEESVNRQCES